MTMEIKGKFVGLEQNEHAEMIRIIVLGRYYHHPSHDWLYVYRMVVPIKATIVASWIGNIYYCIIDYAGGKHGYIIDCMFDVEVLKKVNSLTVEKMLKEVGIKVP